MSSSSEVCARLLAYKGQLGCRLDAGSPRQTSTNVHLAQLVGPFRRYMVQASLPRSPYGRDGPPSPSAEPTGPAAATRPEEVAEMTTMRTMPIPPTGDDRQLVFTSSQAARYLGVSLATIRRWTDAGHIACYRTPGGQRRFSKRPARRVHRFAAERRGSAHDAKGRIGHLVFGWETRQPAPPEHCPRRRSPHGAAW